MTTQAIEVLEPFAELAQVVADYPHCASAIALDELARKLGCSREAIDVAEQLEQPLPAPKPEIEVPPEIGALEQWVAEVRRGQRRITDIDDLSRSAQYEAGAREELLNGFKRAARESRLDAARVMCEHSPRSAA